MPALRVHDPRRGEAASPFDGQVSPLALCSSALHWSHTRTHTHTKSSPSSPARSNATLLTLPVSDLLFFLVLLLCPLIPDDRQTPFIRQSHDIMQRRASPPSLLPL